MADFEEFENKLADIVRNVPHEEFIYEFLLLYNTPKATITKMRKADTQNSFFENVVELKQKVFFMSVLPGEDLMSLLTSLKENPATFKHRPRFIIVTDYQRLCAYDTKLKGLALDSKFDELHINYEYFLPLAGRERYTPHQENHADVKAAEKMAKLYDEIIKENPEYLKEEKTHELNVFLTRLLFCFFAEDTKIFGEDNIFTKAVHELTREDGSDLDEFFKALFEVLDTKSDKRKNCSPHLKPFPYVNGRLFSDIHSTPRFNKKIRDLILECGDRMNWSEINPDIFGSMFQAVSVAEVRSGLGQHYTSVPNIMKVISPLFLDELKEELEKSRGSDAKLSKLLMRISEIKIFDPACGSGNFLIIAYKQLRMLEIEIMKAIQDVKGQLVFDYSGIQLSNFFGIEIDDFACEIARLSLYLAQHQMNQKVQEIFGIWQPTLPLGKTGNIVCSNATRIDWDEVCPREKRTSTLQEECNKVEIENSPLGLEMPKEYNEIYVLGNPPYLGSKLQKDNHKADLLSLLPQTKNLDYISCWFYKGAEYVSNSDYIKLAFVSTNSVCQGEQVANLWGQLEKFDIEIGFAYRSFKWSNNAKYNAGVTCVILGLRKKRISKKFIYENEEKKEVKNINFYLLEFHNIFINRKTTSISNFPDMKFGNMANDGGGLILSESDLREIDDEIIQKFVRPLVGSMEFIKGTKRYCLWIRKEDVSEAKKNPYINSRIEKTKKHRLSSKDKSCNRLATRSYQFRDINEAIKHSIIVPRVSSERRLYIPIGFLDKNVVISDSAQAIYDASLWLFAVITSRMHMTWVRAVGGRLKTDYRYSAELCYNTFPFPDISERQKKELEYHTKQVIEAREAHSELTMAELYDPDKMPENLRQAHESLDIAVEQCYRKKPFESDEKRLEYLFKLYEKMSAGQKLDNDQLELL